MFFLSRIEALVMSKLLENISWYSRHHEEAAAKPSLKYGSCLTQPGAER